MAPPYGVTTATVLQVHPDTFISRISGKLVAATADGVVSFAEADGESSDVGVRIVQLVDGVRSVQDIIDALHGEFEVSRELLTEDVVAFVGELLLKKVVAAR